MLEIGLSLCQLLDPLVLANPYPLYRRLQWRENLGFRGLKALPLTLGATAEDGTRLELARA